MKPISTIFYLLSFIFCLSVLKSSAMKGRLLLVGGGSEQTGGWSNPAYKWAVDKSANKRVAIIGVDAPTSYLRDYFKNSLGAVFSKDFTIGSAIEAQSQVLYDSLITYDVIFFRGGDQSVYYSNFKNSKLSDAVKQVFNNGGVIGGTSAGLHILSGIIYSAADASITPEQAIANVNSGDITLENDFLGLFPGYIFDSHVAERGRFPRTISFLARWYKDKGEKIKAVAMDDLTAMGIDTNQIGEVFGTGAAGIYQSVKKNGHDFALSKNNKLAADSIKVRQVINGWKYNFKTDAILKPSVDGINLSIPINNSQNSSSTILLSASETAIANQVLANQLVKNCGGKSDRIVIITGDSLVAAGFHAQFAIAGASRVTIVKNSSSDASLIKYIKNATKFVFVANTYSQLNSFFNSPNLGAATLETINSPGSILAFIGGNSRFAASRMLSDNYTDNYTAYKNQITTSKGFGFLRSTIVYPGAFATDDTKENAVCSIPYFMMKDSLQYGIMLNGDGILKYEVKPDGKSFFTSYGIYPAIVFNNYATSYSFSNTTSKNNGTQQPRQISGFDSLYISFVDTTNPMQVGAEVPYKAVLDTIAMLADISTTKFNDQYFTIYPNPTNQYIDMRALEVFPSYEKVTLIDYSGRKVYESDKVLSQIPVFGLPTGIYILLIHSGKNIYKSKIEIGDVKQE